MLVLLGLSHYPSNLRIEPTLSNIIIKDITFNLRTQAGHISHGCGK